MKSASRMADQSLQSRFCQEKMSYIPGQSFSDFLRFKESVKVIFCFAPVYFM
jgi:hypothetical protein